VTSIDAGATHACAVTSIGTQCWGDGNVGQLGDGRSSAFGGISAPTPGTVITSATYTQVSAGGTHTCAVTTDGHVHCWGRNAEGQLGTGSFVTVIATPVQWLP
jgi:alpha-tubulin suppressor-like RCC1 family protein